MSWSLRTATIDDLDQIMALETTEFVNDAWSAPTMASELTDRHGYYIVVAPLEDAAHVIGYAGLRAPRGQEQGDIQTIAVAREARGNGLGRALMHQLIGEARTRGIGEIFLEVRADNPVATALYVSLGFEQIAVRPKYYQPDGVDAIVMRLAVPEAKVVVA